MSVCAWVWNSHLSNSLSFYYFTTSCKRLNFTFYKYQCTLPISRKTHHCHHDNADHCRLRDCNSASDTSSKRYIITAPPSDFLLLPSDTVFVLMQFDQGTEYRPLIDGIMLLLSVSSVHNMQWEIQSINPLYLSIMSMVQHISLCMFIWMGNRYKVLISRTLSRYWCLMLHLSFIRMWWQIHNERIIRPQVRSPRSLRSARC